MNKVHNDDNEFEYLLALIYDDKLGFQTYMSFLYKNEYCYFQFFEKKFIYHNNLVHVDINIRKVRQEIGS
jgi:hypothetical protein